MRLLPVICILILSYACTPPVRTIPRKFKPSYDTAAYAGIIMPTDPQPDLRGGIFLAEIEVKDRGWSLDCKLPEVQFLAREKTRSIGGNLLVVYEHRSPEPGESNCHRLIAKAFRFDSLNGQEATIYWSPARSLNVQDLRNTSQTSLPSQFQYRLIGDYYNEINIRTITTFETAKMHAGSNPNTSARIAQLYFDIAEIYARLFKKEMDAREHKLGVLLKGAPETNKTIQSEFEARLNELNSELSNSNDLGKTLQIWEQDVTDLLQETEKYKGDLIISLKPPKRGSK
ncbi:MAG: hypothetical protein R2792_02750 [Saprospiraceae bacterium]